MAIEMVSLPAAAIPDLRRMLTIGLASLAEIERIDERFESLDERSKPATEFRPVHPTGCMEAGDFAAALLWLDQASPIGGK